MITTAEIIKIKKPDLGAPIIKEMANRFSPRYYSSEKVSEKDLQSMFETVRWAPSARNRQPWYFYWTRKGSSSWKKLISCIPEKHHWSKTASVFILSCYMDKTEFGANKYALYDLGTAVYSLVLQAHALGYYCRQVGNFDREKAKQMLKIPKEQKPFIIVTVGKIGDYKKAPESVLVLDTQKRERKTDIAKEI